MSRALWILTFAAGLLAGPAWASKVVEVRVGNHPTFTRVVFELDAPAGYRVERHTVEEGTSEILVTLEASSTPRSVTSHSAMVERVAVQDGRARSVAHIRLKKSPSRVKELILSDPPRIVFDLMLPEKELRAAELAAARKAQEQADKKAKTEEKTAAAEPQKLAAAPKPTPKPSVTPEAPKPAPKPSVTPEPPKPAPKPSVTPEPPKPAPELSAKSEAPKPAPKLSAKSEAPKPAPKPWGTPEAPKPAPELSAKPEAPKPKAEPALPAKPPSPTAAAEPEPWAVPKAPPPEVSKQVASLEPEKPKAPAEAKPPKPVAPRPVPKEAATKKPAAAPAPKPVPAAGGAIDWVTWGGAAAGVLVVLLLIVLFLRRRALPNDLDVTALAEEESGEGAIFEGGFAMGEEAAPAQQGPLAPDTRIPEEGSPPGKPDFAAGPGLFDDEPEKENEAMDMERTDRPMERTASELPTQMGAAAVGGSDIARLVQELERRVAQLETRLDEAVDARERLERQVAAQSEELRVQRAAIARTQRALRSLNRGEEEQATEPALREPSSS